MREDYSSQTGRNDIQKLLDRQDIQDVISRYSLGQDLHQGADANILQQWDETFAADGTVDYSAAGGPIGSYRTLAAWMRGDATTPWQHEQLFKLAAYAELADRYAYRRYGTVQD